MGDYPLVVNGYTFQNNPESRSRLIAVAAYNLHGSGNGHRRQQGDRRLLLRRPEGQGRQRAVRLGRPRDGAQGCRTRVIRRPSSGWSTRAPRSARPTFRKRRSTRMLTSCRLPSCCRSGASPARSSTASRPTCRPGTASSRAPISPRHTRDRRCLSPGDPRRAGLGEGRPKRAAEQIAAWTGTDKEVVYIFLGPAGS